MKIIRSLDEVRRDPNTVVTVGTFDGVHRAHQEIIRELVNRARMREGRSLVVTFDPHPKEVVASAKGPVQLLTTPEERAELLGRQGIDLLLVLRFTPEFAQLGSRDFYRSYLVDGTGIGEVIVGYDHMFGRNREAGARDLVEMGQEFDFSVFAVHPYAVDGETVSSTKIRHALRAGEVERAARMLGRPYAFTGRVVAGDGRGRRLGFPTANLQPVAERKIVPGRGVYLVAVTLGDNEFFGMMNIGVRPTVTEGERQLVEVHLFDFERDIYGADARVSVLRRLRAERKFSSVEELVEQLDRDKSESLRHLAQHATNK